MLRTTGRNIMAAPPDFVLGVVSVNGNASDQMYFVFAPAAAAVAAAAPAFAVDSFVVCC